ncbi:alpha/beta fold hydrolase [Konateibacter massiliensis]|uniref:alpha/beta fold hydrolase n=1 Tax=Konateibacter massiliensis TaxID=2002841 RepID=UPI000C15DE4E|nr:alpha/beta fold hydrolase [Konateibacter massiliensis]
MKIKNKLKYAILFGTVTAFSISIINKLIYVSATLKNNLSPAKGKYYNWRFGKVFYTKQGTGSPLLLIHDLDVCSSSSEWREVVKKLSINHTVYTLDLLGCGLSDKPYLTYTNYLYVQLISDFIKNVIGHKTDVIASGFSSSFTIMACHNDSSLFHKIMLVNPDDLLQSNFAPSKKSMALKILFDSPIIGTLIYNIIFSKNNVRSSLLEKLHSSSGKTILYLDEFYEAAHLQNCQGKYLFASMKGRYTNVNIIHALKEINNSIYIVAGNNQDKIKIRIENYSYYNPSVESFFVTDTRNYPHIEKPSVFLEQVNIFFDN